MSEPTIPTLILADGDWLVDFSRIITQDDPRAGHYRRSGWTPRNADLLHGVAHNSYATFDQLCRAQEGGGMAWLATKLPSVALRHADPAWAARFVDCFEDLAVLIEDGEVPTPRCAGEAMALHVMLGSASWYINEKGTGDDQGYGLLHCFAEVEAALPREGDDYDLAQLDDVLVAPTGVDVLFGPDSDGLDSSAELAARFGFDMLHPRDWFTAFDTGLPVLRLGAPEHPDGVEDSCLVLRELAAPTSTPAARP